MTNPHGSFLWYELLTTDPQAAAAFYGGLLGWQVRDGGQSDLDYRLLSAGGTDVAGLMALPPGAAGSGMGPGWLGYLAVEDVDAAVRGVEAARGTVLMPPQDIPGIGRFAFVADPQGAPFYVMRGEGEGDSRSYAPDTPGHVGWNELTTSDPQAAFVFYSSLFGWRKGDAMEMGAMGVYQILALQDGDAPFGALMPPPDGAAPTRWTFYFSVDDIDAATVRATAGGAAIQHGPSEVPGGDFIILGTDPQGAAFALVGPRNAKED
ncbi:MAG TPA: VOC family protein [Thermoanaerobaculia bacterium]|nr:VOC family protein [Thermoanaerobaculia bacterium]